MVAILGLSRAEIAAAVQAMYTEVAQTPTANFHFPVGRKACEYVGYPESQLAAVPDEAASSFAGVGYPFRAGVIGEGDRVLDVGAGSGTDTLICSSIVGDAGHVWALDFTPEMLGKLRRLITRTGIRNVEVVEGSAEAIPLPDASVDVVTTNGVLNLVPDKRRAFAEIFRVLRPNGRLQIADIAIRRPVAVGGRSDPELWAQCVVGASLVDDYLALLRESGFSDVRVLREFDYFAASPSAETRRIAGSLGAQAVELTAVRPASGPGRFGRLVRRFRAPRLSNIGARGLWGAVGTAAALASCYGLTAGIAVLAALGMTVNVDPGLWAGAIATLAVLAVAGISFNAFRHRRAEAVILAALGGAAILYVMFGNYDPVVEAAGFVALAGAAALDLYLFRRYQLC